MDTNKDVNKVSATVKVTAHAYRTGQCFWSRAQQIAYDKINKRWSRG